MLNFKFGYVFLSKVRKHRHLQMTCIYHTFVSESKSPQNGPETGGHVPPYKKNIYLAPFFLQILTILSITRIEFFSFGYRLNTLKFNWRRWLVMLKGAGKARSGCFSAGGFVAGDSGSGTRG